MGFKETLIERIVDLEWTMFRQVRGQGGPAPCQQDRRTFEVMRRGQALSWSPETLESYLEDLEAAQATGRNLITEKYARMMASTTPAEYAQLGTHLPHLEAASLALIDAIVANVLEWEHALEVAYPNVLRRGRPLLRSADRPGVTSLETYLRGELATYSDRTLKYYHAHIQQQVAAGINGARITLEYMVCRSGFASLAEAEQAIGATAGMDGIGNRK
jgi:hypothetical protein